MVRFLAINTIGLTGAEIVAAELARYPEVLMLPGQNFIGFQTRTYRPHYYAGWCAADIFANLNKHHTTRAGRVWSGLTKSMSPQMLASYDRDAHEAEFTRLAADARTTIDHFENFTTSFAVSSGRNVDAYRQFGFFGFNIVLNAEHYPDFVDRALVVDFTCPIDYWLANIGQRAVWDCFGAIRFWLANMLLVRRWARSHPQHYLRVDIRDFADDPTAVHRALAIFLQLNGEPGVVPDGFLAYDPALVDSTERIADDVRAIYEGYSEFDLASSFDNWADAFLDTEEADRLIARFERFWDSTSHTNLDWAGPVAEQLVRAAVEFTGATSRPSTARWFYHEAFQLHSDDYQHPKGSLEHYLGDLEDEIVLPAMAAHVRIVLCYLERIAENTSKRAYSALPIRETGLYRRLLALNGSFAKWDVAEKFAAVEAAIDEADLAMAKFF